MEHIPSQSEALETEVATLISETRSFLPFQRQYAERVLHERKDEFFEPLLQMFERETAHFHGNHKKIMFSTLQISEMFFSIIIMTSIYLRNEMSIDIYFWVTVAILFLIIESGKSIYYNKYDNYNSLTSALSKYRDIGIIGPMAEVLWFHNQNPRRSILDKNSAIEDALIATLPMIESEDDLHLTSYQVNCLTKAINQNRSMLSIAILQAMPFIGNIHSLQIVRRVAKRRKWIGNALAAQECLPALEARVARLSSSETLLRPSSASEIGNDVLLQAAFNPIDTAPDELLRAAAEE